MQTHDQILSLNIALKKPKMSSTQFSSSHLNSLFVLSTYRKDVYRLACTSEEKDVYACECV